jgi:hypothetical protein
MTFRCAARGNESLYREVNERIEHLKSGWLPLTERDSFVSVGTRMLRSAHATRDEYVAVARTPRASSLRRITSLY